MLLFDDYRDMRKNIFEMAVTISLPENQQKIFHFKLSFTLV